MPKLNLDDPRIAASVERGRKIAYRLWREDRKQIIKAEKLAKKMKILHRRWNKDDVAFTFRNML